MTLFFVISIGLIICSVFSICKLKRSTISIESDNNYLISYIGLLWIIFFFFLTGFRDFSIGNDTTTYIRNFNNVASNGLNVNSSFEKGYIFFTYILSKISKDPHCYLVIHALICYTAFAIYIFKYSKNIMISVTLLFCFAFSPYTNIMRQALAMVICLYAYEYLKKGKKIKFIILVLFSSLLHTSALICLLLLLYSYLPQRKKTIFVSCLIAAIISISGVIISLFLKIPFFYSSYAESKYAGTGYIGVTYQLVRAVFFIAIFYYAYPQGKQIEKANLFMLLILTCLGYSINIFTRMSDYFLLPLIVEVPNCFYTDNLKNKKGILLLICFIMLAYFIVVCIYRPEWNNLYPYKLYRK